MNIILRELKANRKSLIFWAIGILFMASVGLMKFTSSAGANSQALNELVAQMPQSIKVIFGMSNLDLSNLGDYYGVLFPFIAIIATLQAALLGANIIAKEERDKTSEFLYVKPISRAHIMTDKLIAVLIQLLFINIMALIGSFVGVMAFGEGATITNEILMFSAALFGMQLFFMAIGFFFAAFLKNSKLAPSISACIMLVTFLLAKIIDLAGNISFLDYVTPFKYYDPYTMLHGNFNYVFVVVNVLVVVVCIVGAYFVYNKRDITI